MAQDKQLATSGVTLQFKRFMALVAVSFALYRLLFALFAPDAWHIPDQVLLGVMVGLVGYLWLGETRLLSQLSKANKSLRDAHVGTLAALVAAVEAKDPYTRGHSEQVRRLSVALAEEMGINAERIAVVSRAAVLHDVGKLETPDAILHKADPLTQDEWRILKRHPERTAAILSSIDFLAQELRIALFHHERPDGKGYAAGLTGSAIPIEASIIAVADTFDAMNSDRPYRPKLARDKILEELRKSRDVQHPGAVLDAFQAILAHRPELWIRMQPHASDSL